MKNKSNFDVLAAAAILGLFSSGSAHSAELAKAASTTAVSQPSGGPAAADSDSDEKKALLALGTGLAVEDSLASSDIRNLSDHAAQCEMENADLLKEATETLARFKDLSQFKDVKFPEGGKVLTVDEAYLKSIMDAVNIEKPLLDHAKADLQKSDKEALHNVDLIAGLPEDDSDKFLNDSKQMPIADVMQQLDILKKFAKTKTEAAYVDEVKTWLNLRSASTGGMKTALCGLERGLTLKKMHEKIVSLATVKLGLKAIVPNYNEDMIFMVSADSYHDLINGAPQLAPVLVIRQPAGTNGPATLVPAR